MKIYICTIGDYSAKHIVGVFSTLEKAETYQKAIESYNKPQEYEVDVVANSKRFEMARNGLYMYTLYMDIDGDQQYDPYIDDDDEDGLGGYDKVGKPFIFKLKYQKKSMRLWVWAEDPKHATKIAKTPQ